jgi:hypothetical protein
LHHHPVVINSSVEKLQEVYLEYGWSQAKCDVLFPPSYAPMLLFVLARTLRTSSSATRTDLLQFLFFRHESFADIQDGHFFKCTQCALSTLLH